MKKIITILAIPSIKVFVGVGLVSIFEHTILVLPILGDLFFILGRYWYKLGINLVLPQLPYHIHIST
jgi:hypothetical protein